MKLFEQGSKFFRELTTKKAIKYAVWIFGLGILFVVFLVLLVLSGVTGKLPDHQELISIENPSASEVYSADSVLMGRYYLQERSNVPFNQIPKHVTDALVSTEDARFYSHHGIDYKSLARVLVKSILLMRESSGGGSTISQQLAKNLFPRRDYWILSLPINKIREMITAVRLENTYNKESIIALYLNTVPFGGNTFGIESAAQRFFSVSTQNLSVEQGAVLIGMLKATYTYNPKINPEKSRMRRNVVISQMAKYSKLEKRTADSLMNLPLELHYNKITLHSGLAPYFRENLRLELLDWCKKFNEEHDTSINLYTAGLKIYTTINSKIQQHAEQAVKNQMAQLQKQFLNHWKNSEPWESYPEMLESIAKRTNRYKGLREEGLSHKEAMQKMNEPETMEIFTWNGVEEVRMSSMDSIRHYLMFLNAGFLAIDPENGEVRAWVGGIDHNYFQYDHIRETTKRQVGSIFKPIVYATAIDQGVRPCAFTSSEKVTYTNVNDWSPENASGNYNLKYSMPGALAHSVNTVSIRILEKAGIQNTISNAHKMGITSDIEPVPSIALGTPEISVLEMTGAYTCFVNNGEYIKPHYISTITTHNGQLLQAYESPKPELALSSEAATLVLHMLRRAINEGTSSRIRTQYRLNNDIAGKTGTTQSYTDGWFMAMTPKLVIGTWVGADDPRIRFRNSLGQGASTALPIVADFIQQMNNDAQLSEISYAKFPELTRELASKIDCDLSKEDHNIFRKLFEKNKEQKREFSKEKKKGFLRRLFEKN